jgi:hypothetical protein
MKKQKLPFIFLLLSLSFIYSVNASVLGTFIMSPTPISVEYFGSSTKSHPSSIPIVALYNISVYQSMQYYFYGTFTKDGNPIDGFCGVWVSSISIYNFDWNTYDTTKLTNVQSFTFTNGEFNFAIAPESNSSSNTIYKLYVIDIYNPLKSAHIEFVLDISYIKGGSGSDSGLLPYIDVGFGTLDLQSLVVLSLLVFIPSLIMGIAFSEYDLGFIGFLCGVNLMGSIAYQVLIVPLWFLFVIMIIDIIMILMLLHSRGIGI